MLNTEKKLTAALSILSDIDFDIVDYENYSNFEPATVRGMWNPDLAYELRRRAQGKIFSIMKKAGLPLMGWNQFNTFVNKFNGHNLQKAYRAAAAQKTYIYEFIGDTDGDTDITNVLFIEDVEKIYHYDDTTDDRRKEKLENMAN